MMLTLLLIGGITITLVTVHVTTNRSFDVAKPVLVGETTAVGLADPASETLTGNSARPAPAPCDWQLTPVNALSDAEEMLDYLEAQGYSERELIVMGNSCFAIRWR